MLRNCSEVRPREPMSTPRTCAWSFSSGALQVCRMYSVAHPSGWSVPRTPTPLFAASPTPRAAPA
eukprot:3948300-Alexandrium_andersonii.AAC.1